MMQNGDAPWPNREDRLFKSKPPIKCGTDLRVGGQTSSEMTDFFRRMHDEHMESIFRDGYFNAAENLAYDLRNIDALERGEPRRELDGVYLPMLYCYRHYLEVTLKHQIVLWAHLSDLRPAPGIDKQHPLIPLWDEFKRQRHGVVQTSDARSEAIASVERGISDFHDFDPTSVTFRYRQDTSGKLHDDRIPEADLTSLIQTMRGLRSFFDAQVDVAWEIEQNREV